MVLAPIVRGRKGEYGRAARGAARGGLHAREGRRRAAPARRGDRPRQEVQARHRGRRRPARDARRRCASGSPTRSRRRSRWRTGSSRSSWSTSDRALTVLREVRLPRVRHLDPGARAADLLLQRAARRLPALHRARLADGDRPGAGRAGPDAVDRRGRDRAVVGERVELLRAAHAGDLRALRRRPRHALAGPAAGAARLLPVRHQRRQGHRPVPQPLRPQAHLHDAASRGSSRTSSAATSETDSDWAREKIEEYMSVVPCPECGGARLRPESRAVLVGGTRDPRVHARCRRGARCAWVDGARADRDRAPHRAARCCARSRSGCAFLENVGVGYLSMDRAAATLSGGEAQRIRLATQIGSSLVGVLYILDEPSIGLHQRDNEKLIGTLERLRDLGNTVLVVEHDEGRCAPPTTSSTSGRAPASTAAASSRRAPPPRSSRSPESADRPVPRRHADGSRCRRGGARPTRLRRDQGRDAAQPQATSTCEVPLGVLHLRDRRLGLGQVDARQRGALQGGREPAAPRASSGRARTARIAGLDQLDKIIAVDQSPIGRTPRSNPATYIGLFDLIRDLFSKTPGGAGARLQARALLLQRQGRALRGLPRRRADQDRDALPARRLRAVRAVPRQALQPRDARGALQGQEHRRRARACRSRRRWSFFEHIPKIRRRLETLHDVGLGYMRLGQPATTLSGGEAQRVKLADRAVARSRPGARSTSSTSRRPACTSPTSSGCWRCCSGSSTRATGSS